MLSSRRASHSRVSHLVVHLVGEHGIILATRATCSVVQAVVPPLLTASRVLASSAVLVGLAAALLLYAVADFIYWDSCPKAEGYFSGIGRGAAQALAPCIALATLALALFLAYCLTTRQLRRAVIMVLVFLAGHTSG